MQRVMIVGGPGSGKSTLARALGAATGLPVVHVDHIHWQPGWVERAPADKLRLAREVHSREAWIFEGNLASTFPERIARADTLIWLDLPVGLRLWRIVRRTLTGLGRTRPDLPADCPERLNFQSLEFWKWTWDTRQSQRTKLLAVLTPPPPHLTIHHLTCRREVARFRAAQGC